MKKKTFIRFMESIGVILMLISCIAGVLFVISLLSTELRYGLDRLDNLDIDEIRSVRLYLLIFVASFLGGGYLLKRAWTETKKLKESANPEQMLSISYQTVVLWGSGYALWAIWHLYLLFAAPSDEYENSGEYFWFFDSERRGYGLRIYDMSEFCIYVLVPLVVLVVIVKLADIDVKKKE